MGDAAELQHEPIRRLTIDDFADGATLVRAEVAEILGVKVQTLNNWLADPKHPFPRGIPLGAGARPKRVWFARDVRAYLETNNGRERATAPPIDA